MDARELIKELNNGFTKAKGGTLESFIAELVKDSYTVTTCIRHSGLTEITLHKGEHRIMATIEPDLYLVSITPDEWDAAWIGILERLKEDLRHIQCRQFTANSGTNLMPAPLQW